MAETVRQIKNVNVPMRVEVRLKKKTVVIKSYELFEVPRRIRLQNVAAKCSRKIVVHKKRKSVERAVTWVSQDVHFIVSLNTAATSHRKPASAENRDHFEAVLLKSEIK